MVMFENTPIETTIESNEDMAALIILGCGIVLVRSDAAQARAAELNYKLHTVRGHKVGISFFTYQV